MNSKRTQNAKERPPATTTMPRMRAEPREEMPMVKAVRVPEATRRKKRRKSSEKSCIPPKKYRMMR